MIVGYVKLNQVLIYLPEGQMSCKNEIDIIQGEDIEFIIKLRDENGDPVDLNGSTDVTASFLGLNEPVDLTIEDQDLGFLTCYLTKDQTALLQVGILLPITVSYVDAEFFTHKCIIKNALNVYE